MCDSAVYMKYNEIVVLESLLMPFLLSRVLVLFRQTVIEDETDSHFYSVEGVISEVNWTVTFSYYSIFLCVFIVPDSLFQ